MEGEAPTQASTSTGAVFLSYACQDVEPAQRICEALRSAGVEVWLDQSELRGGDAWDQSIRDQIKACALFIPVISANAHARVEGYFRLEWKLAIDRSHRMAPKQPFLLPVVIDDTRQADDAIPDRFRELQWTRLPGGQTPQAFVERVQRLLSPEVATTAPSRASAAPGLARIPVLAGSPPPLRRALPIALALLVVAALAYLLGDKLRSPKPGATAPPTTSTEVTTSPPAAAAFNPPPHSIAVLPFVNMSGDKEQEYFSDGLTEEILNSLARMSELQVSARTSAFSFKGKDIKIGTIAHELNVGSILEGSVRRSGHTIRVTAQLNNAVTGFHLWSQTYDRDLSDVLQLQTEIANAVANALKVTLLGDVAAKIEVGGTRNPTALDWYLRASKAYSTAHNTADLQSAVATYSEAIQQDPRFALAFAGRSEALNRDASEWLSGAAAQEQHSKALADARQAIVLAPELAEAHLALGTVLEEGFLDFGDAASEYTRAIELAPGNARVLQSYGSFAVNRGRTESGLAAIRHAISLDPLNTRIRSKLGEAYWSTRQYDQSLAAFNEVIALDPEWPRARAWRGFAYYLLGDFETARLRCEARRDNAWIPLCLALVYQKLGRQADAEALLAKLQAAVGEVASYQYAEIYAQRGDGPKAREWLATAVRVRDPGLTWLKTDPFLDPVRKEPWFKAIERELRFPD
jgi:TolB-like protein/Flp pilus assembly protein TadD